MDFRPSQFVRSPHAAKERLAASSPRRPGRRCWSVWTVLSAVVLSAAPVHGQPAPRYPLPNNSPPNNSLPNNSLPNRPLAGRVGISSASAEDAEIIAVVGDEPILAGELLPQIRELLAPAKKEMLPEEYERQKRLLLKRLVEQRIQLRALNQEFWNTIPPDKRKEAESEIAKQLDQKFYKEFVPKLLKDAKLQTVAQLDAGLRRFGSSLDQRKQEFRLQAIAQMMVSRNVPRNAEVTHEELLAYYQQHLDEFSFPARARWEKLTVLFEKFPNKAAAELAIVDMGNQVLRGAPFAEVAKRYSQGPRAEFGGRYDWTSKGALVSDVLDRAIFSLPVGKLSQILEDRTGFHIVRVLERHDAGRKSFAEVQEDLRKRIQKERFEKKLKAYLDELRAKTYVWTVFDEEEKSRPARP